MPLKVIVVGAGIASLCAAVSIRQAGHSVQVSKGHFPTYPWSIEGSPIPKTQGMIFPASPAKCLNGIRYSRSLVLQPKSAPPYFSRRTAHMYFHISDSRLKERAHNNCWCRNQLTVQHWTKFQRLISKTLRSDMVWH